MMRAALFGVIAFAACVRASSAPQEPGGTVEIEDSRIIDPPPYIRVETTFTRDPLVPIPIGETLYATVVDPSALAQAVTWANANRAFLGLHCGPAMPRDVRFVSCDDETTDADLARLPSGLVALTLSGTHITNDGLAGLSRLTALRSLSLPSQITDAGMIHIAHVPALERLDLSATAVQGPGLSALAHSRLRSLKMPWLRSSEGILLAAKIVSLEDLELEQPRLTEASAAAIAKLPRLESLSLVGAKLTTAELAQLAKAKTLRSLDLRLADRINDFGLEQIGTLTGLRSLALTGYHITDVGFAHIARLHSLRWLSVDSAEISDAGLASLFTLKELRWLSLRDARSFTDAGLGRIRALTMLRSLRLPSALGKESVAAIGHLGSLRTLKVGVAKGVSLAPLASLSSLVLLDLSDSSATDAEVAPLSKLPALTVLDLSSTRISGTAFANATPRALRRLDLERTPLTDAGFAGLARLTTLESLSLASASCMNVSSDSCAGGVGVTDARLASLVSLRALRSLDLNTNRITDDGMTHVARLSALARLDVTGTLVTDEGLAKLRPSVQLERFNSEHLTQWNPMPIVWCDPTTRDSCPGL